MSLARVFMGSAILEIYLCYSCFTDNEQIHSTPCLLTPNGTDGIIEALQNEKMSEVRS